jgi:ribosomal protein S18 acetylase RimI-like enzyme
LNSVMNEPAFSIRPYRKEDHDALYEICLVTGDSGVDASSLYADPMLLGHIYCGPYLKLEPELAFTLEDALGPCGYVIGALNTPDFEDRLEREWWPELRMRYPDPSNKPPQERSRDERIVTLIYHPHRESETITTPYPSHLHIDLLPRAQAQGMGKRLMQTLFGALRAQGSTGVHLGVGDRNLNAIGFYERIGFQELSRTPGAIWMGLKL